MNITSSRTPISIERWRWGVVWLMFFATLINYMDRNTLNNAERYLLAEFVPASAVDVDAPTAAEDLSRLRNQTYAQVQFAFGIAFALFQVVAGFLIDRFSLRILYLVAIVIWSAAGVLTGFVPAGAIGMLVACRVVLGIGEAFNWPCAVACIRRVIPRESRGMANGIFHSGASIGAVATPLFVLMLVDSTTGEGWRILFIVVGAVGFVWALAWWSLTRGERSVAIDTPPQPDFGNEPSGPSSFLSVFGLRTFWICLATGVCVNLCWHFYVQWFPRFLTEDVKTTGQEQQWVLACFFIAADLGSMFCGWLTLALARAGFVVERSRQIVMTCVAVAVCSATLTAVNVPLEYRWLKFGMFFFVAAAAIGGFTIFFSLAQDIIPRHTAKILGVCGCMSWIVISAVTREAGGLAGPGQYGKLFLAVSCVPLFAASIGWLWPRANRTPEV